MENLRFRVVILLMWLAFLFNIEQVVSLFETNFYGGIPDRPVNILYSYSYLFIFVTALFILLIPQLKKRTLTLLIVTFSLLYTLLTIFWHHASLTTELPFTITQISALITTVILARWVNLSLQTFEESLAQISFNQIGHMPIAFSEGQGRMYSEIRRARRYERPISMLAIKFDDTDLEVVIPKIMEDAMKAIQRELAIASIATNLKENTQDFDTIAIYNDYFLVVLPEVDADNLSIISQNLTKKINENLKITLQVGMANYPKNSSTFEGLVALAMHNANEAPQTQPVTEPSPQKAVMGN